MIYPNSVNKMYRMAHVQVIFHYIFRYPFIKFLSHFGLVTPYDKINLTAPSFYWTNIDFSSRRFFGIHLATISQQVFKLLFCLYVLLKLLPRIPWFNELTHWGRVTHICVSKLTINVSKNGLSPDRRQIIIWANAGILLMRPPGTDSDRILIEIHRFSLKKMHLEVAAILYLPQCVKWILVVHLPVLDLSVKHQFINYWTYG